LALELPLFVDEHDFYGHEQDGFDDEQNLYGRKVAVWPWNCFFSLMNMIFMGMNGMLSAGTGHG